MSLLGFYSGTGSDDRGRRLEDIWRFSHAELEAIHDFIQWLFPLAERSAFNPGAPVLDDATIQRFKSDATLQRNLERSLDVMLDFYGFARDEDRIVQAPSFAERSANWLTAGNHNFLRLTRILKSLTLLGLGNRAAQLLECLEFVFASNQQVIGQRTITFWRQAAGRG
jgi:hypothetical protein